MKLNNFLIIFAILLLFSSCSEIQLSREQLANTKFNLSLAEAEMNRERSEKKIPFTMNYSGLLGSPVCKYTINGIELITVLDTGCSYNTLYKTGLGKLNNKIDINELLVPEYIEFYKKTFPEKSKNKTEKEITELLRQAFIDGVFNINDEIPGFGNATLCYFTSTDFDLILGQNFFRKYKTVTFDFVNNYLFLDDNPLEGYKLPLITDNKNLCHINIIYNNQEELGLVDTGSFTFIPRKNFGDNQIDFSEYLNKNYHAYESINEIPTKLLTFNKIYLGNFELNDIKGYYSDSKQCRGLNNGARLSCMYISNFGCELFKNRIFQFDYVNNEFIIK